MLILAVCLLFLFVVMGRSHSLFAPVIYDTLQSYGLPLPPRNVEQWVKQNATSNNLLYNYSLPDQYNVARTQPTPLQAKMAEWTEEDPSSIENFHTAPYQQARVQMQPFQNQPDRPSPWGTGFYNSESATSFDYDLPNLVSR